MREKYRLMEDGLVGRSFSEEQRGETGQPAESEQIGARREDRSAVR